jgi:hypothetical protein
MTYCCESMKHWAENQCETHPDRFDCPDALVHWSSESREYGLIVHDGGSSVVGIAFCPWCGAKLSAPRPKARPSFPVVAAAEEIVESWAAKLAERAGVSEQVFRSAPIRHLAFPSEHLRVRLMDGSSVEFKYAFALHWPEKRAIAVFTEHCGHHLFPDAEASIEAMSQGPEPSEA